MNARRTTSPTPASPGRWVIPHFGPPSVLSWETFDRIPVVPADHAYVRVIVAGIAGPDNIMRAGGYPDPITRKPGFTPGYDLVGEIVRMEGQHETLHPGDYVASMCTIGAHATHTVIPTSDLVKIRKDDDFVKMCALPLNYTTAWGMLWQSGALVHSGSSILIGSAAGGIGTAMAQLVKAFDLALVGIGISSVSKFDHLRSLGVIPVDRHDPNFGQKVKELSPGGVGVDVAFDAVCSMNSLQQSYKATKDGVGRVIGIGVMDLIAADGSRMLHQDLFEVLEERKVPRFSFFNVQRDYYTKDKDAWTKDLENMMQKVRLGKLDPKIAKLFRLKDAVRANELLVSEVGVAGKMEYVVDEKLALSLKVQPVEQQ